MLDLKVDIPELDPDPVLLEQLSRLSAGSTASHGGQGAIRTFLAAASVAVIAGASWLTGTLPGVASPFHLEPADEAPRHAPADPADDPDGGLSPEAPPLQPPQPPGQGRPGYDNGNHYGQTKPHQNNGNHYGQTKPHQNNGNHHGQTKPHQNNGNHYGQTRPHDNNGNADGNGNADQGNGNADQGNGNADQGNGKGNGKGRHG